MNKIDEECIGQIAEIFDATEPQYSKGCFAQAWSVAEILRAFDMISKRGC
jgi:glycogen debranching enzyme